VRSLCRPNKLCEFSDVGKMASKIELPLHLEKAQIEWLEAMAKKYNLPSAGICFPSPLITYL
jgi:hypothetical protein